MERVYYDSFCKKDMLEELKYNGSYRFKFRNENVEFIVEYGTVKVFVNEKEISTLFLVTLLGMSGTEIKNQISEIVMVK